MTRYVGQHRIDPPRGRHRVERLQLAAVDPLLGASGALATGAVAAIFLSGAVVLPHLDPAAPFRTSEPPSVAAPGITPGAQPTVSVEGRSIDLSAWLAPATTTGACSAWGNTLTGPVAAPTIRTASTAALLAGTSTTGSSLTDPGSASPSDTAPAAPSADGTPGGATTPTDGTPTDGTPTDGTTTSGGSTTPGGSTTIPGDAATPGGGTTTTPGAATTTPGGGTTTDPGTCGSGTP